MVGVLDWWLADKGPGQAQAWMGFGVGDFYESLGVGVGDFYEGLDGCWRRSFL